MSLEELQAIEDTEYFDYMMKAVADPKARKKIEEVVAKWIEM